MPTLPHQCAVTKRQGSAHTESCSTSAAATPIRLRCKNMLAPTCDSYSIHVSPELRLPVTPVPTRVNAHASCHIVRGCTVFTRRVSAACAPFGGLLKHMRYSHCQHTLIALAKFPTVNSYH